MKRKGILNYSHCDLQIELQNLQCPKYTSAQIFNWLYSKRTTSFDDMSNLNLNLRKYLNNYYYIFRPNIVQKQVSQDGTIKFLLQLSDKNTIETVFIPSDKRNTVCVSSQVGCAVGCKFCNTGYNGFKRNLLPEEIISQILILDDLWQSKKIINIVFMGMGEPLYNWKNVSIALENLSFCNISYKHVTLSTSGIIPILKDIIGNLKCNLAISLHAPTDEIRSSIMPINNLYKLQDLLNVCKQAKNPITFEYLMLNGINDSLQCARQLIKILHGIKCKVNLIKFNNWKDSQFIGSSDDTILLFQKKLQNSGIPTTIRYSRGIDIMAACGQLQQRTDK